LTFQQLKRILLPYQLKSSQFQQFERIVHARIRVLLLNLEGTYCLRRRRAVNCTLLAENAFTELTNDSAIALPLLFGGLHSHSIPSPSGPTCVVEASARSRLNNKSNSASRL
jgi:hypothetical protein